MPNTEDAKKIMVKRPMYFLFSKLLVLIANNREMDMKKPTETKLAIKRATVSINL